LACTPPDPPERPEVIAVVDDPDDPPGSLLVRLMYGAGTGSYQGEARMTYDARRKAYVYRMPPVTARAVGREARGIMLEVAADDPSIGENVTPPTAGFISIISYCLNPS
jgi:hypothetical protein